MLSLSPRLSAVCDLVPTCRCVADIGTDHAYVPIFLTETGRIQSAVASDIHEGPAKRAEADVAQSGLRDKISVRIGAGLTPLAPGEADGAVIAGMGGLMIIQILKDGKNIAETMDFLVLQPQNHQRELRKWLAENGFRIDAEQLAKEDRMLYQILRVRRGTMTLTETEEETGVLAIRQSDPLFPEFLKELIRKKDFTVRGVSPDSKNERNIQNRNRAILEKQKLEELLWNAR